ncbi:RHS repeat-associated core domain-containing protein, partial [Flavobacterium collinsii]|uniref:RHS repeat-associated core domain-containing protein n=1 Tax=Flavobacterium collinsii TaxID=1114861 RepID=UPI00249332D7
IRLSYDTTLAIKEENNYYPFGLKHEGYNTVKSGVENKYKYNGKELQDELGQNVYAFGWRDYDPTIARFLKIDRFSEKYSELTPYNFTANSPLIYREIAGDSINVSRLMGFDRVTNGNATQRIINDLNAITGLNLSVNQTTGLIEYQRDANGNIVIRETNGTQEGSATARTDLINIINGPEINISGGGRSVTSGNEIAISSQQIDSFVNGTPSQLDNRTLGYGIVIMHEFRHTTAAGGAHDPPLGSNGTGPVVDRVNIYRRELDNNSTTTGTGQFGQRTQYYANPNGNTSSIDFQYQTVNRNGRTVTRNTAITF